MQEQNYKKKGRTKQPSKHNEVIMAVIKANVQEKYFVITNDTARDPNLSLDAKGLIMIMASRPNNWNFNKAQLMNESGVGRDKLNRIFKELVDSGYLAIAQNHDDKGQFQGVDYYFFADPSSNPTFIRIPEKPSTDNPCNGKSAPTKERRSKKERDLQNGQKEIIDRAFKFFWDHYPKKVAKDKAISSFKKLVSGKSESAIIEFTDKITNYMLNAVDELNGGNTKFLGYDNMNASTYLNQKRWEDE